MRSPVGLDGTGHDMRQRSQVRGLGKRLGDGAQLTVEEGAREIPTCLDIGRIGSLAQGGAHLFGDRQQGIAEHLKTHRINACREGTDRLRWSIEHGLRRHAWSSFLLMADNSWLT